MNLIPQKEIHMSDFNVVIHTLAPVRIKILEIKDVGFFIIPSSLVITEHVCEKGVNKYIKIYSLGINGEYLDSAYIYNHDVYTECVESLLDGLVEHQKILEGTDLIPIVRKGGWTGLDKAYKGYFSKVFYLTSYTSLQDVTDHLNSNVVPRLISNLAKVELSTCEINNRLFFGQWLSEKIDKFGLEWLASEIGVSVKTLLTNRTNGKVTYRNALKIRKVTYDVTPKFYEHLNSVYAVDLLKAKTGKSINRRRFGRALREYRVAHGVTSVEIAERVGLIAIDLSGYEHFLNQPSREVFNELLTIIGLCGTHVNWDHQITSNYKTKLIKAFEEL